MGHADGDTRPGLLLILSGPSGTGKSTIVQQMLDQGEFPIEFSVSATSRPPRPGEVEAKDYYFVSAEQFRALRDRGELLEYAQVHDRWYGTPRKPVEEALARGRWMLLEIDVQGHRQVKKMVPEAVSFFVRTQDLTVYENRLRQRGTESDREIEQRLDVVRQELSHAREYDFQIVNEDIDQAVRTWRTLLLGIRSERCS